jgi:branched-subunit amino acid ABC-type transport system permease component
VIYAVTALDGLAYGLLLFVVAAGLTLIFGVMGVLNLAHGSFYLAGGCVAYLLCHGSLADLGVALLAGAVVGAGGGAALAVATRPLARYGPLLYPLATLGLALLAADAYKAATGGGPLPVDPPDVLAGSIHIGQYGLLSYRLVFIAVAALLGLALHLVVSRSRFGVQLRATVADPVMAAATGVNTRRVQTLAMAAGGALAVVGGVLGAPILGPAAGVDNTVLVYSLIIVVVGGAGSIPGTLVGALLVGQVITSGVLVSDEAAPFALFAVLLAVLTVRARYQTGAVGS